MKKYKNLLYLLMAMISIGEMIVIGGVIVCVAAANRLADGDRMIIPVSCGWNYETGRRAACLWQRSAGGCEG